MHSIFGVVELRRDYFYDGPRTRDAFRWRKHCVWWRAFLPCLLPGGAGRGGASTWRPWPAFCQRATQSIVWSIRLDRMWRWALQQGQTNAPEAKLGCTFTQARPDEETGLHHRDPNSTTGKGNIETAKAFGRRIPLKALRSELEPGSATCLSGRQNSLDLGIGSSHRVNFPLEIWIVDSYRA